MEINEILYIIEIHTGLKLTPCNHFTGVREHNGKKYFNVILPERISESNDYLLLERFAKKYGLISIEPNGLNRIAIFVSKPLDK